MDDTISKSRIAKRHVLHFPGFEPLDATQHRERYTHTVAKAAELWDFETNVAPIEMDNGIARFTVDSRGQGWHTASHIHVFDHDWLVEKLANRSLFGRFAHGYKSAARVVMEGGAAGYMKHGWRFGLFFVFPFLIVALALAASLAIATYPFWFELPLWHFPIGLVLAWLFFMKLFLPWSEKYHVLHLFSDWEMAVAVAALDRADVRDWLEQCAAHAKSVFEDDADEYLVSSHSMGSSAAVHVIGMLLERDPHLLDGKRVVFATLGGAILQCALLKSAKLLRARTGMIAHAASIKWFEVQCLTDAVNFYKSRTASILGHADAPQPVIRLIRIKNMLTPERYRRIKWDMLRVHRQYVLASDKQTTFDFSLMTAGPLPAIQFASPPREGLPELAAKGL